MFEEKTIKYVEADGPVTIEIVGLKKTLGNYNHSIDKGDDFVDFGDGDISDTIPDRSLIPAIPAKLSERYVFIIGNYAPGAAEAKGDIAVDYIFKQKGQAIDKIEIRKSQMGALACDHLVDFEKI